MALLLLLGAVLILVYAPWSQEKLRVFAVEQMNRNGMTMQLDSLRLHFPLDIELAGLQLDMPGQSITAGHLEADVKLLPLLRGQADIGTARLADGSFTIGTPDSAMYMTIRGREITLRDASVGLATMNIDLEDGLIRGGRVDMTISPDTTATDTAKAEPTKMSINVRRLALDDFAYTMRMLPTIDSLGAAIPQATATGIAVDLYRQTIDLRGFTGEGLGVAYIAPDSATVAATPVVTAAAADSTSAAAPWTINIDTIGFARSKALYTTRGVKPAPGLDFTYIEVDSLDLSVSHFFNQAATLRVPLRVSGTERCGVTLATAGTLNITDKGLGLDSFSLSTPRGTDLDFSFLMGMGDMTAEPSTPLNLDLDGTVAAADARLMFPAFAPYFAALPPSSPLHARARINGTSGRLNIADLSVAVGTTARLTARGTVMNVFDPDRLAGNLALSGALVDMNRFKSLLLDKQTAAQFNFPATTFSGRVDMAAGHIEGNLEARTHDGKISLDADWHSRREDYTVDLRTDRFPVAAFMPLLGVGDVSATLSAHGHGYDPFSRSTTADADLHVTQAVYRGYDYKGIDAKVNLADGRADIDVSSTNPNARFDLRAAGNLDGDTYTWTADLKGDYINLQALGFAPDEATVQTDLTADASLTPAQKIIGAKVVLNSLTYKTKMSTIDISDVTARLNANDSTTNMSLANGDLYTFVSSEAPLDTLMTRFAAVGEVITQEMDSLTIDVDRLQRALPPFTMDVTAGPRNAITDILAESRTGFDALHLQASNDSSLAMQAELLDLHTASMRLDTITFDLSQYGDRLVFGGRVENRPGTFDEWAHVRLDGFLADNRLGMQVSQRNIAGKEGYNAGLNLALADSTVTFYVDPTDPTIAYQAWTVNEDNYIKWSLAHKHLDANLHMHSDKSSVAIYTNHVDGDDHQEALTVNISDINIADWIKLNPFAPPVGGTLSANIEISQQGKDINGDGSVTLTDLSYDRRRVGTIRSDLKVATDLGGMVRANADMFIDGKKTVTLAGALNDSTAGSPLAMDLSLIHFPLEAANPFIGPEMASLTGSLNGSMDVSGSADAPRLDGWLQFDSAAVKVTMIGTSYKFNDVRIPVDSNVVRFTDFAIRGVNDNPLRINGTADLHNFASPRLNLSLTASNMQICDSKRASKGADIYGKGFISLKSTLKGDMNFMQVNADLSILSGTNLTYVMPEAVNTITNQANSDMVKFVNFADSAAVQQADSITESSLAMLINASLTVQTGSTINVDLSTNGRNRVSLQPDGTVDFTMQPFGQPRLTGRLNIPKGYVRYTPPLMSEKLFNFEPSSYVAFNGDMMNPTLNVKAVDVLKANVTQSGQNSRLVNFDVMLSVTGTLENMNVAFDLSTDDDITVANELQAMSAEQRANQAMNLLLYNVYTGPGTRGDAKLSGNPLYSFLTSQLNNWAANTIKGVDLSFGIDQYDRTVGGSTSQTTSYSYQVSKSLFNDRFKIVVGGNYSTDANADENFSQNLIKDISFEYFINKAQTMYVRLFRHTGYESILEGEITRTGVGFVYKKKLATLRDLFGRRKRRTGRPAALPEVQPVKEAVKDEK